jgi:tRNA G10  N-methylase Trm11
MNNQTGNKYKFATLKENYEDYSSGRVLYGTAGATNFPVRLINEIFQRATARLANAGVKPPYSIYDPFCGAGYSLTVLGMLHGSSIENITASDINKNILETATKNLSLLTTKGFTNRVKDLEALKAAYGKSSHSEALESAARLEKKVSNIPLNIFEFNILGNQNLPIPASSVDLVLCDLPYGQLTDWQGKGEANNPSQIFLDNIRPILKSQSVVVISSDKKQKLSYQGYQRVEKFILGKRQIMILIKE